MTGKAVGAPGNVKSGWQEFRSVYEVRQQLLQTVVRQFCQELAYPCVDWVTVAYRQYTCKLRWFTLNVFFVRYDLVKVLHDASHVEISDGLLGLMKEVRLSSFSFCSRIGLKLILTLCVWGVFRTWVGTLLAFCWSASSSLLGQVGKNLMPSIYEYISRSQAVGCVGNVVVER